MLKRLVVVALVVGISGPAMAQLTWFTDQDSFEAFNLEHGKVLKGIEDYEESNLPDNGVAGMNDPLESGVPNGPYVDGLTGLDNLRVQSNLGGANHGTTDPRGASGLAAFAVGRGHVSDVVISNFFTDSHDLIFLTDDKTGVGGDMIRFSAPGTTEMSVYDINNNFLGMMASPSDPAGTNFLGVWSEIPIGRINLFAPDNGAEGMDNIQAWIPEPASLSLLALGSLMLLRRRS